MQAERAFRLKVRDLIIYPLANAAVALGATAIVLIAAGRKLALLFSASEINPPLTGRIIIALSSFLIQRWYAIALALFFLIIFLKIKIGKKAWDYLAIKLPVISPLVKKINIINTVGCLSPLISAGSLGADFPETAFKSVKNYYYQEAITRILERLKKGDRLSSALKDYPGLYPVTVPQMVEIGEETGKTAVILEKLSGFLREDVLSDINNLRKAGDPLLMLVLGSLIGFLAVSIIQSLILF